MTTELREAPPAHARPVLALVFRRHAGAILAAYGLFVAENLLRLAQPIALGWAIDGLLRDSWAGLAVLAGQHLAALCVTATRQAADTRVFGGVYARLVAGTVLDQRGRGVPAGTVAARSGMSREFVDFFEIHLPALVRAGFSVAGAALALFWFDPSLVGDCLLLLVPAGVLNWWYGRRTLALSRRLHGELENEVGVIEEADAVAVRGHYRRVAGWWVRMSDAEAVNVGLMELFVLGLVVVSLVRYCGRPGVSAGEIFAVLRYVLMFVTALDALPGLVRHVSRLRDIAGRVA